ncbi:MAG: glycoside hydrolase, partial [Anaerolineales bacterium]|nr:glycoside hydrolase [Anaerolineales bacterium]
DMTQASTSSNALFPLILCDQYQNTHILWSDRFEESTLYYMNDISGDWSAPIDVITNADAIRLMIKLSAVIDDNTDILHVLWADQWIKGGLHYSQAPISEANNPRAWMNPVPLAMGTENGAIEVDADGNLHVVYGTSGADNLEVGIDYIRSDDGGNTWSIPIEIVSKKVPFPSDPSAEIAVDGYGRIHVGITYRSQDYGNYSEVGYARSIDGGYTWSDYELIDYLGTAWQGVSTISPYAFGENEIHLTWHDPRRMHRWSNDGGSTWSEPGEIMRLGAAFGGPNALTQDSSGAIHVVTAINQGVYSARWDGSMWGPPERIEDREIDPHGQEIAICQGNKLQIVYDDRNDSQKIWYSNRNVDAPRIERQPMFHPVPTTDENSNNASPINDSVPTANLTEESSPTSQDPIQIQEYTERSLANPLTPLLVASGIVIALILVVILIKRR